MRNFMKTGSIIVLVIVFALAFDGCNKETLPTASFTWEPSVVIVDEVIQFTSTSSDAESYMWDFGNQQVSNEANPTMVFNSPGSAAVTLTVTNSDGSNSITKTVPINSAPLQ